MRSSHCDHRALTLCARRVAGILRVCMMAWSSRSGASWRPCLLFGNELASAAPMQTQTREPKGKRHRLTVLFSDLVGSTVLGRDIESEDLSELLGQLRQIWHRAVAKHGGRVIRTQGDGALAVFGYPLSGEDDGRRAAEAAIDIHLWVGQLRHDRVSPALMPLRMHSGIHAGTLLLTEGDIESGRYDLIG